MKKLYTRWHMLIQLLKTDSYIVFIEKKNKSIDAYTDCTYEQIMGASRHLAEVYKEEKTLTEAVHTAQNIANGL